MLRRAAYAAIVTYRGVEVPEATARWEPLVSVEDWRVVQAILDRPARRHGQHDRGARTALLTGLTACGVCGGPMKQMSIQGGPNTGKYPGLTCVRHQHLTRKARPIEAYAVALAMSRLGMADAQATVLPRDPSPNAESLVDKWNAVTAKRSALADLWVAGVMPDPDYMRLSQALGHDLAALEDRLARLQVEPHTGASLPRDPPYALVGLPLAGLRTVLATLMDLTVLPVRPGRQPFRPESVQITWRISPGEPDSSGRAAEHRPSDMWWAEVQDLGDEGLFEAAEAFVASSPPPPLPTEQRRVLWAALTPAADLAADAEV